MRDARFVSLTSDGQGLVLEHEGRHLRLPLDARVRAALSGEIQIPMPLETHVRPREIQHRLRCGESAADIAARAGVAVELIARFEGPVIAEREWHIQQARKTVVDDASLDERVDGAVGRSGDDAAQVEWEAWLGDDNGWQIRASLPDGRVASWAWDPRTHRLRARDDLARVILSGDVAGDDLDAVLRPVASAREAQRATVTLVPAPVEDEQSVEAETPPEPEPQQEPAAQEPVAAEAGKAPAKKRRASVPAWDDIVFGTKKQPRPDDN